MPISIVGPTEFYSAPPKPSRYRITGITRDTNGTALGSCTVEVYESVSNLCRGTTVSDANGNYSLEVDDPATGLTFFAVAYLPGSPDVTGATVNTLQGTWG